MSVQPAVRRGSAYLVGFLFKNTKLGIEEDVPNLLTTLVIMLTDNDQSTVQVLQNCQQHLCILKIFVVSSIL